jgi:sugar phosphate isomerase/epimerase
MPMKISFEIWANPPYPVYDVVNTWGNKSIEEQARILSEIGYQGIEITYPFIHRLKWEKKFESEAEKLKNLLPSLALEISSIAHHVLQCIHPWPWVRRQNIEYFKEGMIDAKKIGSQLIHSLHANSIPARPIQGDPTGRWMDTL